MPGKIHNREIPAKAWCPLAILILTCLGLALYYPVISADHGTDDDSVYFNNPAVYSKGGGWQTAAFYSDFFRPIWRPLTTFSYRLDWMNHSRDRHGPIVTNIALLILIGVSTLLIFRSLGVGHLCCLGAAMIVIAHPGQAESVTRLAGRAELLSNALLLLACLTHFFLATASRTSAQARRSGGLLIWALLFIGALFAKETALVLPIIAIGFELTKPRPGRRTRLLAILAVSVIVITSWGALRQGVINGWPRAMKMNPASDYVSALTETERVKLSVALPGQYGQMMVGSEEILPNYAHLLARPIDAPPIEIGRPVTFGVSVPGAGQILFGGAILLALVAGFIIFRRRNSISALGCLWLLCSLLIVLPLFRSNGIVASSRFLIMPQLGLLMIIFGSIRKYFTPLSLASLLRLSSLIITAHVIFLTAGCVNQNRQLSAVFSTQESLIAFIGERNPESPEVPLFNAAKALGQRDFETAATLLEESLGLFPRNPRALLNLGLIRAQQTKRSIATRILGDAAVVAAQVMPNSTNACQIHLSLGTLMADQDMNVPALAQFKKANAIDSTNVDVLARLGIMILVLTEDVKDINLLDQMAAEAVTHLGRALELDTTGRISPAMRERMIVMKETAEQELAIAKEFDEGTIIPDQEEETYER